jgi:hypothetical protein
MLDLIFDSKEIKQPDLRIKFIQMMKCDLNTIFEIVTHKEDFITVIFDLSGYDPEFWSQFIKSPSFNVIQKKNLFDQFF